VAHFLTIVDVSVLAYVATMIDNFAAFTGQLALAPSERFRALAQSQSAAVALLAGVAAFLGSVLHVIPLAVFALGAAAPWWLGWHAWRQRHDADDEPGAKRAVTVFLVTLALGGDNVAVWIPLFRLYGVAGLSLTLATFAACHAFFLAIARYLSTHPVVRQRSDRVSRLIAPWLYALLGIVILLECLPF